MILETIHLIFKFVRIYYDESAVSSFFLVWIINRSSCNFGEINILHLVFAFLKYFWQCCIVDYSKVKTNKSIYDSLRVCLTHILREYSEVQRNERNQCITSWCQMSQKFRRIQFQLKQIIAENSSDFLIVSWYCIFQCGTKFFELLLWRSRLSQWCWKWYKTHVICSETFSWG